MLLQNWIVGFNFTFNMEDFQVHIISIAKVSLLYFLKTDMSISPVDLYKKFAATDA